MGNYALYSNTGSHNNAIGNYALHLNTTGTNNSAVGNYALKSNTTGGYNSALGYDALRSNTTGQSNSALGNQALFDNTSGFSNTAIGNNTGRGITTGSNNTILGANVTGLATDLQNNIIIADGAGNRRINVDANGNVGIGTSSPSAKLDVDSTSSVGISSSSLSNFAVRGYSQNAIGTVGISATSIGAYGDSISGTGIHGESDTGTGGYFTSTSGYGLIVENGNVGIGTTSPGGKLHIRHSYDGSSPRVNYIYLDDSINPDLKGYIGINRNSAAGTDMEYLSIEAVEELVHWLNIVLAADGGSVGIGTTSPGEKLTVAGTIESTSGGIKFPNGTVQTTATAGQQCAAGESVTGFDSNGNIICSNFVTYAVGDYGPAGGKVFYAYAGGFHGLEAALVDQSGGAEWGCFGTEIAGADGTAAGTGAQNTADILAGCAESGIAAEIADNYSQNGYDDWFLPSKDELNLLYQQKAVVGGFADDYYWSSTEYNSNWAWEQRFLDGGQAYFQKDSSSNRVRAIRAF